MLLWLLCHFPFTWDVQYHIPVVCKFSHPMSSKSQGNHSHMWWVLVYHFSLLKPGYNVIDNAQTQPSILYNSALGTTCPCPTSPFTLSLNVHHKILPNAQDTTHMSTPIFPNTHTCTFLESGLQKRHPHRHVGTMYTLLSVQSCAWTT